eukprot:scaffold12452_cov113-Isochrysis_galbana.AAC.4
MALILARQASMSGQMVAAGGAWKRWLRHAAVAGRGEAGGGGGTGGGKGAGSHWGEGGAPGGGRQRKGTPGYTSSSQQHRKKIHYGGVGSWRQAGSRIRNGVGDKRWPHVGEAREMQGRRPFLQPGHVGQQQQRLLELLDQPYQVKGAEDSAQPPPRLRRPGVALSELVKHGSLGAAVGCSDAGELSEGRVHLQQAGMKVRMWWRPVRVWCGGNCAMGRGSQPRARLKRRLGPVRPATSFWDPHCGCLHRVEEDAGLQIRWSPLKDVAAVQGAIAFLAPHDCPTVEGDVELHGLAKPGEEHNAAAAHASNLLQGR